MLIADHRLERRLAVELSDYVLKIDHWLAANQEGYKAPSTKHSLLSFPNCSISTSWCLRPQIWRRPSEPVAWDKIALTVPGRISGPLPRTIETWRSLDDHLKRPPAESALPHLPIGAGIERGHREVAPCRLQ